MDKAHPGGRVLVVDDDEGIRRILVRFLAPTGLDVVEAATGQRALELARTFSFSVILTDLGLPDMTGAQLIGELRQADPRVRVVILSGGAGELAPDKVAELRADEVLSKPVKMQRLLKEVLRLAAEAPSRKGETETVRQSEASQP